MRTTVLVPLDRTGPAARGPPRADRGPAPLTRTHRHPTAAASNRVGYGIAVALNLTLLWAVTNLLDWHWPPFLTERFDELLPWAGASLLASVAANLAWMWRDTPRLRRLGPTVAPT